MEAVELSWGNVLKIWWAWAWRSMLGALVIGFFLGFMAGFIGAALKYDSKPFIVPANILGFFIGLGWSICCLRWALKKTYRNFRVALISEQSAPLPQATNESRQPSESGPV